MTSSFVVKSVTRRLGRYGFLIGMIAVGIMAVTMVQAVTVGMTENVIEGSGRYLGGRFLVVGRPWNSKTNTIENPDTIVSALEKSGFSPSTVVKREVAADSEPMLFFNGESFKVRRVSGVDFEAEAPVFRKLAFVSGGIEGLKGSSAILISKQVAERFGARVGDAITLRITNNQGYIDSADLVVKGIFKDASIFGYYNCYMDIGVLSKLMGDDPEKEISYLGFYFDNETGSASEKAARMTAALAAAGLKTFEKLQSKDDADSRYITEKWEGVRYSVLPVEDYIDAKVMDLIHAIQLVSYLFLGMMLVIILVGMRNTMRLMVRKRFKELGTIRALGLSSDGTRGLVLRESLLVASIGFLIGLAAALVILSILGLFPFEWPDGFDIFLKRGHLTWNLSLGFLALNYIALCLMTVAGADPAARQAAAISPAEAMAVAD